MRIQQELKWQSSVLFNKSALTADLLSWLLYPGSFMQHLEQRGAILPHIKVLQQDWLAPLHDEREQLMMPRGIDALIREVLILSEGKLWMFARTVFPRETLTDEQEELAHLNTRSLGSVLFKDPTMQRSEFEIAKIDPDTTWHHIITQHTQQELGALWARRSRFMVQQKPLLLTEVFLPDIETL